MRSKTSTATACTDVLLPCAITRLVPPSPHFTAPITRQWCSQPPLTLLTYFLLRRRRRLLFRFFSILSTYYAARRNRLGRGSSRRLLARCTSMFNVHSHIRRYNHLSSLLQ